MPTFKHMPLMPLPARERPARKLSSAITPEMRAAYSKRKAEMDAQERAALARLAERRNKRGAA